MKANIRAHVAEISTPATPQRRRKETRSCKLTFCPQVMLAANIIHHCLSHNGVGSRLLLLHSERFAATYARMFELPMDVSEAGSEAHYEDGVLTLMLPKRLPLASKKLTIS